MKKLLYIDACVRQTESRTRKLAAPVLDRLSQGFEKTTISLAESEPSPITDRLFRLRSRGIYPENAEKWARLFSEAEVILIAAPFWDMSFPSVLKVFFEQISIPGITFRDAPDGNTVGACRASELVFVTTRGMDIETGSPLEQATPYLRALCALWGIDNFRCVAASGMDTLTKEECEKRLSDAEKEGVRLAEKITDGK